MILNGKRLTPREEQLARGIADAKNLKEIAAEMGIGYGSVRNYMAWLVRKLEFPPYGTGNLEVALARLVWEQDNPVRALQAMAQQAAKELSA